MHAHDGAIRKMACDLESEFRYLLARLKAKAAESGPAGSTPGEASPGAPTLRPEARLIPWLLSTRLNNVLALPFIYGMAAPLLILDISVTVFQAACFRLFGIQKVRKADYIALERHNLGYLNILERLNCDYCAYANGVIAFAREVLSRTEQYFCPIKHAHKLLGTHERYALFLPFGEGEAYHRKLDELRNALKT